MNSEKCSPILFLYLVSFSLDYATCAKILGIFPLPAFSHFSLGFKVMNELAGRGHEITFINPYPRKEKIENYKDVSVAASIEGMASLKDNYYNWEQWSFLTKLNFEDKLTLFLTEETLKNENVQNLLQSNKTFDLVFMEYSTTHPLMIFAHFSKCPVVILAPEILTVSNNIHFANPMPSSYVPNLFTGFTAPMPFWERLQNTLCNMVRDLKHRFSLIPQLDKILKKYVKNAPDLTEFLYNVSFMFLNSHPSFTDPIPLQFNIKEVGGFHVEKLKPLPKDIQEYMDNATDGVVVFSMGSNLKSSDFPKDKLNAVLESFGRIKEKVLWKFEADELPEKPANVRIMKWLPQNDILDFFARYFPPVGCKVQNCGPSLSKSIVDYVLRWKGRHYCREISSWPRRFAPTSTKSRDGNEAFHRAHPNTKAFISHGGILSTIETVYHGVPMIGLPVFWDQKQNMKTAAKKGYALYLPFQELNDDRFSARLNQILTNPQYRENAKYRSKIMRSDPINQLDSVMFWMEYVLKYKNVSHLESPGLKLMWYQRNLIDVIAFLSAAFVIFVYVSLFVLFGILFKMFSFRRKTIKKKVP